jgi:steroid delta-isomerase-like uncharacterized protein
MSDLAANKALTVRFMDDVWSKGDMNATKEILSPDFVFLLGVPPYEVHGIPDFEALVNRNRAAFQGLTYEADVSMIVAEGDMVVTPWRMYAKHVGMWAGFTPSNKDVSIHGMTHMIIRDGKIAEARVQNEALSLVRQVGGVAPPGKPEYKVTEANKEAVRRYIDALLVHGNFALAAEVTNPGFYIERSAVPENIAGPEGLHKQMDMLKAAFPDLELQIADLFAEGDKVAVRFVAPGTHTGDFAGVRATGRHVTWKGIVVYEVKDDKVSRAWACWDDVGLLQAIQTSEAA